MSQFNIATAQNVVIQVKPAEVGARIGAALLDELIKLLYVYAMFLFLNGNFLNGLGSESITLIYILLFLPVMTYTLWMEYFFNGQTIGKRIGKIRVLRLDGQRPEFLNYFSRWIFRLVEVYAFTPAVGLVIIMASKNNQRLGDAIAGTSVVLLKAHKQIKKMTPISRADKGYVPMYPNAGELSDIDLAIIGTALRYSMEDNNPAPAIAAAEKVSEVLKLDKMPTDPIRFLNRVLADAAFITYADTEIGT